MNCRKEYFEWDVCIWSAALPLWRNVILQKEIKNPVVMEIGGRRCGMSLFLAKEFGFSVLCTDLENPEIVAYPFHEKHNVTHKIKYASVNCLDIPHSDDTFDFIIFKSILGALQTSDNQKRAISEMKRVLKPGGVLLFAENIRGSVFHVWSRNLFVSWAKSWRYVDFTKDLKNDFFKEFQKSEIYSNGFISLFCRNERLRILFNIVDKLIVFFVPARFRYMDYGYAIK
jgi:ubiquinone/menaquinone biosynthesis C-methylase UbiE